MPGEPANNSSTVQVQASSRSQKDPPPWLAQAIVVLQAWKHRGLVQRLQTLNWVRPCKKFVLCDLVLVLVALAVSRTPTVRMFYRDVAAFETGLAAIWDRVGLTSRANFTKMLQAVDPSVIAAIEPLFLSDLIETLPAGALEGLIDHLGERHLLCDMDPTRLASLEREIAQDDARPPVARRRTESTAAGYSGRKRADRVRTRTAVLWTGPGLWMLTFGQAGNGKRIRSVERSRERIRGLFDQLRIPRGQAVVRMDGEWGHLPYLVPFAEAGLGYLARTAQYKTLLQTPEVQAALAQGSSVELALPDSRVTRQVFDVPKVRWRDADGTRELVTRLVVTRRVAPEDKDKIRVGCLLDGWVYELFVTDRSPEAWTAAEVVTLYLGRGTYERTLALEDAEQQTDHWITHRGDGEDLWQLVCQWFWNQRVVLGTTVLAPGTPSARILAWEVPTVAIEPVPVRLSFDGPEVPTASPTVAGVPAASEPEDVAPVPAAKPVKPWGPDRFVRDLEGVVHCPAGQTMRCVDRRRRVSGLRERYQAPASVCAGCPHRAACRGAKASDLMGRKVDLPLDPSPPPNPHVAALTEPEPTPPEPEITLTEIEITLTEAEIEQLDPEPTPTEPAAARRSNSEARQIALSRRPVLYLYDLDATLLRKTFDAVLWREHVTIAQDSNTPREPADVPVLETRDRRAHRRRTWAERLARNARSQDLPHLKITIAGVPPSLAHAVGLNLLITEGPKLREETQHPLEVVRST